MSRIKPSNHPPTYGHATLWVALSLLFPSAANAESLKSVGRGLSGAEVKTAHPAANGAQYHSLNHTNVVKVATRRMAKARGLSKAHVKLLGEVALLHDWDPQRQSGTPPRVAETIKLLRADFNGKKPLVKGAHGSVLKKRFGWGPRELKIATAIIQRTEYPFAKEHPNPAYNGTSPVERYTKMLGTMNNADRTFVLHEAPLLSEYADKSSTYAMGSDTGALRAVEGLASEIRTVTKNKAVTAEGLGTASFLRAIGKPSAFEHDHEIAKTFGLKISIPNARKALRLLGPNVRKRFLKNRMVLRDYFRARKDGATRGTALRRARRAARRRFKR